MPEEAPAPALTVNNLTCRYHTREEPTLKNISLSADQGEIVLIAGTSGSGKTTLLRCINGLIPRSYQAELEGEILFGGENFSGKPLSEISQIVGTVLQDPERQILGAFVKNEVAFGLENQAVPREEMKAEIDRTLSRLKISHLKEKETFSLSGGEKQKVALAGVLVMKPSILALDEPLASLDPTSAREALQMIRSLADQGKTILIIEHRVEDVLSLDPDQVLLLEEGEITYQGAPEGLLEVADYRSVKLPAPVVIDRAKEQPRSLEADTPPAADPDADALVQFERVSFHYPNGPQVINGIDLSIRRGDIIALLGPNGAGKTTLIKHAIGLLKPKEGRVLMEGKDSRDLSVAEMAQTVGYVFQSPTHMLFAPTVREELTFGPRNLNFDQEVIEKNIHQALDVVGLSSEIDRAPLALSFGQQKRVTIASVLAMRSKILVMDEPTAGQDLANYMNFMDAVVGLRSGQGAENREEYSFSSIIFITHDVDLAVTHANRILLLSDGRLEGDGPPEDVLSDFELLRRCNVIPTSLLKANLEHYDQTGKFMRAEALASALST
jgi:energy-coupling factor transport system ATP-binding protein